MEVMVEQPIVASSPLEPQALAAVHFSSLLEPKALAATPFFHSPELEPQALAAT